MAVDAPAAGSRLAAAERGCLVLADISGYTTYLLASELEHAEDVLVDLTQTIVRSLKPVLKLSKLEGDAAFAYVIEGEYSPSTVLDTIEQVYFAFRSRLRDITLPRRARARPAPSCRPSTSSSSSITEGSCDGSSAEARS